MPQADFSYDAPGDAAGLPVSVSVFADRPYLRDQVCDDLRSAGFRIGRNGSIAALLKGDPVALGDAVLLDCPDIDAEGMAALSRLDMRVAQAGSQLIVSTSLVALDDVFACLDQSRAQILVDASRAERIVAVGRILGAVGGHRLREMSKEDRVALLHLSQQVDAIARQLDNLSDGGPAFALSDNDSEYRGPEHHRQGAGRPPLPDPSLVRQMIRQRQTRAQYFDAELFADPAWDMLLDLTAAHGEHKRVSVSSLCIAAGVPPTTALRWIRQMVETGLFDRVEDARDRRRAYISLSERAVDAMARYFAVIAGPVAVAA
ncbi:winged helix DNA-binding protein [Altererythrobacter arenosus]|uniref:Winged helix DNA-binding protein n=1 Tax=Altererythrobacter arenosus TaxID=3032592 RepID=A0ABY8FX07_9SPHN|nr:winged helix DNA-binding protein [Altererythrobacter sp. CAU 1644]WFL77941.1 winged helix DNA-binding protein [Altererythrobacter sp. CAU 1644]